MNPTIKEQLQKYISLIQKELKETEPNYIALQVVIDNFLGALPQKLKDQWQKEQATISSFPIYISNENASGYRQVFEKFLNSVVIPEINQIKEQELIQEGLNPAALKILVEDREKYLQDIKLAETSWKGKWKETFQKQIESTRRAAIYALTGELKENVDLKIQTEIADVIISGAQALHNNPLPPTMPDEEKKSTSRVLVIKKVQELQRYRQFFIGLDEERTINQIQELSQNEAFDILPTTELTPNALIKESNRYAQVSSTVETENKWLETVPNKDVVITQLTSYQIAFNKLVSEHSFDSRSALSIISQLNSIPELKNRILALQQKYLIKLNNLNVPGLTTERINSFLQNPHLNFSTIKSLRASSYKEAEQQTPLQVGKVFGAPTQNVFSNLGANFQILVKNVSGGFGGFGSIFGGFGNVLSSGVNNVFPKLFNLGGTGARALSIGSSMAASGKNIVMSPILKYKWLIVGFFVFTFVIGSGFSSFLPTSNNYDMVVTAAMVNNVAPPPEVEMTEILPGYERETGPHIAPNIVPCIPDAEHTCGWPTTGCITVGPNNGGHINNIAESIDIGAPTGTSVISPFEGTITAIRNNFADGEFKSGSWGNYVDITTTQIIDGKSVTFTVRFAHLQASGIAAAGIVVGQQIHVGEVIGTVDDNGNSFGHHLHYEIVNNKISINSILPYLVPNCPFGTCAEALGEKQCVQP